MRRQKALHLGTDGYSHAQNACLFLRKCLKPFQRKVLIRKSSRIFANRS